MLTNSTLRNSIDSTQTRIDIYMNNIKQLRDDNGITQASLAKESGCKQSTFSTYERGERHIKLQTARDIKNGFKALGLSYVLNDIFPDRAKAA